MFSDMNNLTISCINSQCNYKRTKLVFHVYNVALQILLRSTHPELISWPKIQLSGLYVAASEI